jgi:hypothetical protein
MRRSKWGVSIHALCDAVILLSVGCGAPIEDDVDPRVREVSEKALQALTSDAEVLSFLSDFESAGCPTSVETEDLYMKGLENPDAAELLFTRHRECPDANLKVGFGAAVDTASGKVLLSWSYIAGTDENGLADPLKFEGKVAPRGAEIEVYDQVSLWLDGIQHGARSASFLKVSQAPLNLWAPSLGPAAREEIRMAPSTPYGEGAQQGTPCEKCQGDKATEHRRSLCSEGAKDALIQASLDHASQGHGPFVVTAFDVEFLAINGWAAPAGGVFVTFACATFEAGKEPYRYQYECAEETNDETGEPYCSEYPQCDPITHTECAGRYVVEEACPGEGPCDPIIIRHHYTEKCGRNDEGVYICCQGVGDDGKGTGWCQEPGQF